MVRKETKFIRSRTIKPITSLNRIHNIKAFQKMSYKFVIGEKGGFYQTNNCVGVIGEGMYIFLNFT